MQRQCHLPSLPLTSPPFSEETLVMLATGWDWPTLVATPAEIVEEVLLYRNTRAEWERDKRE